MIGLLIKRFILLGLKKCPLSHEVYGQPTSTEWMEGRRQDSQLLNRQLKCLPHEKYLYNKKLFNLSEIIDVKVIHNSIIM